MSSQPIAEQVGHDIPGLLAECADAGLQVRSTGRDLRVRAIGKTKTPRLIEQIRQSKSGILAYLDETRLELAMSPMTARQRALWYEAQLDPVSDDYKLYFEATLDMQADEAGFKAAVDAILARHEMLRASFSDRQGHGLRCHVAREDSKVAVSCVTSCPDLDSARASVAGICSAPFVIDEGGLIRFALATCPVGTVIGFVVHHLVADFWSVEILGRDLVSYLRGADPVSVDESSFLDFVAQEKSLLADQALFKQAVSIIDSFPSGWSLAGITSEIPGTDDVAAAGNYRQKLNDQVLIERHASCYGVSPFVVVLAVLAVATGRMVQKKQFLLGVSISARLLREFAGVVGFFTNIAPVAIDLEAQYW